MPCRKSLLMTTVGWCRSRTRIGEVENFTFQSWVRSAIARASAGVLRLTHEKGESSGRDLSGVHSKELMQCRLRKGCRI